VTTAIAFSEISRLQAYPTLELNADFRPTEYLPLSVRPWRDVIRNVIAGDVIVIDEHDICVRSPSIEIRLPSVIALKTFVKRRETPALNRHNLLVLRDRCSCAYCGQVFVLHDLTYDHVVPRSKNGPHTWWNVVGACKACNQLKADRTPDQARMPLLWRPWQPSMDELARADFFLQRRKMYESWKDFLPFVA